MPQTIPNLPPAVNQDAKASVSLATVSSLDNNASTSSPSYNSTGGASGRGQITATLSVSDAFIVDGVTLAAADDGSRIALVEEAELGGLGGDANGIYTSTISGTSLTLDRATDFDTDLEVTNGAFFPVNFGTVIGNRFMRLVTSDPIVIGGASGTVLVFDTFGNSSHADLFGLDADDHIGYHRVDGRGSGQTVTGGTGAGNTLLLDSTSDGVKGQIQYASGNHMKMLGDDFYTPQTTGQGSLGLISNAWKLMVALTGDFVTLITQKIKFDTTVAATALGDITMDMVTGEPQAFIDGGTRSAVSNRRADVIMVEYIGTLRVWSLIGNLGEVALEALSPLQGHAYVVSAVDGDGNLDGDIVSLAVGDLVEYSGTAWVRIVSAVGGFPPDGTACRLASSPALISPYTNTTDDDKLAIFDGASLTAAFKEFPRIGTSLVVDELSEPFKGRAAEFGGSGWGFPLGASTGGLIAAGSRALVANDQTLATPLIDGADETKIVQWDGMSNDPALLVTPSQGWSVMVAGGGINTSLNHGTLWTLGDNAAASELHWVGPTPGVLCLRGNTVVANDTTVQTGLWANITDGEAVFVSLPTVRGITQVDIITGELASTPTSGFLEYFIRNRVVKTQYSLHVRHNAGVSLTIDWAAFRVRADH